MKKKEQKNTIKSKPRRKFLRGIVGTAIVASGYGAVKTVEYWPQIKQEWKRLNPPEPEIDLKKLNEIPSEKHRGIKIHGLRKDDRATIKDTIDFMHNMHNSLTSVGIFYRNGIDKLQTFKECQKPIVIDKNLAETKGADASYHGLSPTKLSAVLVDGDKIRPDTKASLAASLHHEMIHSDQEDCNFMMLLSPKYDEEAIKRYDMESEICANTSDAEFEALAYIAERISEGKTKSNDAREIAIEAIEELPNLHPAEQLNDFGKLKQDATIAALRTIAEKGPESVASMDTKAAAYNVIRGHVKGENFPDIPPQTIYSAYAKQNEKVCNYYMQYSANKSKIFTSLSVKDIIGRLYEKDSRGVLTDHKDITYPVFSEENKKLFHKGRNNENQQDPIKTTIINVLNGKNK